MLLFDRKDQQNEFAYNPANPSKDRQRELHNNSEREPQSRAQSVPSGARARREMFIAGGVSPTHLDEPCNYDETKRFLRQAAYQRQIITPDPRSYAGPSEREIFFREKFLFLKERALFLRERQSFILEKELFLMEKRELLRRYEEKPAPPKTSYTVRSWSFPTYRA